MTSLPRDPRGRKLKFKTVNELQKKIQAYFDMCKPHVEYRPTVYGLYLDPKTKKKRSPMRGEAPNVWMEGKEKYVTEELPVTITGLAVYLDTSRETLINYSNRELFFDTISRAKEIIHAYAERSLWMPKIATGISFNLKNNWGWKDQSEVLNRDIPTGFEDLSDDELNQKLEELRRKNTGVLRADGDGEKKE